MFIASRQQISRTLCARHARNSTYLFIELSERMSNPPQKAAGFLSSTSEICISRAELHKADFNPLIILAASNVAFKLGN